MRNNYVIVTWMEKLADLGFVVDLASEAGLRTTMHHRASDTRRLHTGGVPRVSDRALAVGTERE
ncbi:hypothetical protein ANCCAN_25919 [Ancylostoma caninum]|uniref:Uncharacterized protein n=1 Tax=Ancylostoma caninum TaxID=29170 RepID=A0A368F9Q9_ANCCA|nr:hypothetical protein ANCCAN_25919 [Ancylostoma caninum]